MSNHFHLLLKPAPGHSISRSLQSLTVAQTWRHHRRQGTSGHVWQGRFRSPVIQDGDHLLVVLRYIEANPVQGLRITIAKLGYMGSFVSRTNSNFCRTVLRLSDSVVTNTAHFYSRTII